MSTYSLKEIQYLEEGRVGDFVQGVKKIHTSGKLTQAQNDSIDTHKQNYDLAKKHEQDMAARVNANNKSIEKSRQFKQLRNLHKLAPGVARTLHNTNKTRNSVMKVVKKPFDTKGKAIATLGGIGALGHNVRQGIKHQMNNNVDY